MEKAAVVTLVFFALGALVGRWKVVLVPVALGLLLAAPQFASGSDGHTHQVYWPLVILILSWG
jgi:hypothetical protein